MQELKTQITIHAPIEKIWRALVDFKEYSKWNPFMTEIKGKFGMDEELQVTLQTPKKPMKFKPRIVAVNHYEFHWLGKFIIPGLFDGRHSFCLTSTGEDSVQFQHFEVFSGLLHKPFLKLMQDATLKGFEQMNSALKRYCES